VTALTAAVAACTRDLGAEWRRFRWDHPEWTLAMVATAAWTVVFAMSTTDADSPGSGAGFHAHHHLAIASPDAPSHHAHHASAAHLSVMMVAMMLPTILPAARAVSLGGKWKRRQRGPALFAAGYLLVWIAIGLAAVQAVTIPGSHLTGPYVVATALVVAAGWELTRYKIRFLRACCRVRPIAPDGWRADRMCVIGGIRNAIACVGSCWAMMAPMLLADHVTAMMLMIPTAFVVVVERYAVKPRTLARPVAGGLLAAAVVVAIG
jgi:predicted metal-binding membrane protein